MAEHHRKNPDGHRAYQQERALQRRDEFAQWLAEVKGSQGCAVCGERDHRCLVFHHRDPETKKFQITLHCWSRTRESVLAEMAKCDVWCANCHQKFHYIRDDLHCQDAGQTSD